MCIMMTMQMMRNNPSLVRQSNPAFKNMTDEQIRQYADQMEQVGVLYMYTTTTA